jgi:hypothetical protein
MPEEKIPDLKGTFDAFYQRFLLRDLFAKIVPGLASLFAIGALILGVIFGGLDKVPPEIPKKIAELSLGGWLVLIGIGWIAGFAVQSIGEFTRLIIYYPKRTNWLYCFWAGPKFSDEDSWERLFPDLQINKYKLKELRERLSRAYFANQWEFNQYRHPLTSSWVGDEGLLPERMVVIKEACGNAYLALLIILIACVVYFFTRHRLSEWTQPHAIAAVALVVSILALQRMHFVQVLRQR